MNDRIRSWAEEDRPREKFRAKGRRALTDAELLAILLGTGTSRGSAVSLAREILGNAGNDLARLARLELEDLCKIRGVGPAKALTLLAAFELGRRKSRSDAGPRDSISCSADVFKIFREELGDLPHEEFWVLLLNRANAVLDRQMISRGGISGTIADPKLIFSLALAQKASGIVLVHNHPSGNLRPSEADNELTRKMRRAGEFLDLPVMDHLIVTGMGYYSYADEGNL